MKLELQIDRWNMREPFVIAGQTTTEITTVTACVEDGAPRGRGEALGVDYRGETAQSMLMQIEAMRDRIESGIEPEMLLDLMPPGGARNAIDCALWDLRLKRSGTTIWQWLGLEPHPVVTVYTLSLGKPQQMADAARRAAAYPVLKLKLDQHDPSACIAAVRSARPDAELIIDANGSWSAGLLDTLGPVLIATGVRIVEQPLQADADHELPRRAAVPLCADESCQSLADLGRIAERYQFINIKLDKCGGLTEALAMVEQSRRLGLEVMVGNMLGSSLAMAPAFVIAQHCRYVDLDGPLLQSTDRATPLRYDGPRLYPPERHLWG